MVTSLRPSLLLSVTLFVLISCSPESRIRKAIEGGNQLLKEGKRDEAVLNYKKAIQINANSGEAHYGLGRALFTPEKLPEAYTSLIRAAELLPGRADVQRELGDAALTLYLANPSRPATLRDRLLKTADYLLKISPNMPDSFRFRAYVQMADRRPAEAVQTLRQGLKNQPEDRRCQLALVKALLMDSKIEEADATALQFIAKNKQNFGFYDVMIDQYVRAPDANAKVERFVRLKADNNPHSAEALLSLARFHRIQKNADGIDSTLAPLLKDSAHFPSGHLQVAEFYMEAQSYGPAEEILRQAIANQPSLREAARVRLARVLFLYRRPEEAFTLADQMAKDRPKDKEVVLLRADLTEAARRTDRYDLVIAEIQSILPTFPSDPALHAALGQMLLTKGDLDGAAKELEQTVKTDVFNMKAQLALVNVYLQKKNYTQALEGVNLLLAAEPANLRYRLLRATCLRSQNNFEEARAELALMRRDFPNQAEVLLESAAVQLAEGHASQAEKMYRRLYESDRPNLMVLEGLSRSLVAQNKVDSAMEMLLSAQRKNPSPGLDELVAEVAYSSRRFDEAVRSFAAADGNSKLTSDALGHYAEALQQSGDLKQAILVARRARDLDPKKLPLSVFLAFLLQTAGNSDEAAALYRSVIKSQPANLEASNNLAYLLAERGQDLPEANQLANNCVRGRPEDDGFLDTLGIVLYKQGQFDDAIKTFQRALKRKPSQGLYRYHLALALIGKGDRSEAKRELEKAFRQNLDPSDQAKIQELLKSGG